MAEDTFTTSDTQINTTDIDSLELTTNILDMHQEGNFLVGYTDKGVRFRQHIPVGKLLNKIDGRFVLQDVVQR